MPHFTAWDHHSGQSACPVQICRYAGGALPAGDKVLQNIAKTLREVFNSSEFEIFRIGGDEFSVITENILETEIIKKLLLLKKYIEKQEIGLSKGYSLVESDVYEAFKYADDMLYSDKLAKNARENINSDM